MKNFEKISAFQLFLWMLTFTFGDMSIINPAVGYGAGQDSWIGFGIGWILGLFIMLMYMTIIKLNPSKTIIQILKDCFGKCLGIILGICYIVYFMYANSLVVREFGEYIYIINYPDTPILFIMASLVFLVSFAAKKGPEIIARVYGILVYVFIFFVIMISLLLIPHIQFMNILPVLENGWHPIFRSSISSVAFPFGELVIFMMIYDNVNDNENIKKAAFSAMMIGGAIIFITILRDIMVLGPSLLENLTFPGQTSSELIPDPMNISPLIAINLIIGSSAESSTYLYASTKGVAQLLNLNDHRPFVFPMAILLLILCIWNYRDIFQFFNSVSEVYVYFAIPFQVIIPFVIMIISLSKKKKSSQKI
ncbi:endospore germination permease [Clostridium sp. MB40-C1]|uniref:GerAB/ArcD/ProY family transporter n=1 Tax=Clostridium sp. MB40-C1 TaxID=3070996 RepID=UPI0027E0B53D|nr:endospore germination permease [Clostridium sp. MB40-C1]WMJ81673.1 endospore germination permease [Clostridium sp. MB40-C1]